MDITIKNIPDEIETQVRESIAAFVEMHLRGGLQIPQEEIDKVEKAIDEFRSANGLAKMFEKEETKKEK